MKTILTSSTKIASEFIKSGGIVGFPTETVYGLGANVFNENAVQNIFKVKNRPVDNPLITHISNLEQITLLAKKIPRSAEKIIQKYFPGPLTIVLKKNEVISEYVSAGLDSIGIRMPGLDLARKFIEESGVPICAPSANPSGSPSPTSWKHVLADHEGKIPCILKGPASSIGIESTVIDFTSELPVILRPGSISFDELAKFLPGSKLGIYTEKKEVKSPGMKYRHYAPAAKVILVSSKDELEKYLSKSGGENSAFIGEFNVTNVRKKKIVKSNEEYARNLFNFFRSSDESGIKYIFAEIVDEEGIGLAIMNRLRKAALEL
jgi:L-threonylcarbamoyladenylate synthase